jgi:hypothetical protein
LIYGTLRKALMDEDLYKYAGIAVHASNYSDLKLCVQSQITNPKEKSDPRAKYTNALARKFDGNVSKRIASYMLGKG